MAARKNNAPVYPVLEAKIAEYGIKKKDIAEFLNISQRALSLKLTNRSSFSLDEAIAIKREFFPNIAVDELFQKK